MGQGQRQGWDAQDLAGLLPGWLAGWLVGWLAGWLAVCLAGCLAGWLAVCLSGCLAGWQTVCLSVCLLFVYLSAFLPDVCLSVCLFLLDALAETRMTNLCLWLAPTQVSTQLRALFFLDDRRNACRMSCCMSFCLSVGLCGQGQET